MKLKIYSSVGNKGKNSPGDVKLIRALLNCYLRKNKKPELPISDNSDELLVNTITDFSRSLGSGLAFSLRN